MHSLPRRKTGVAVGAAACLGLSGLAVLGTVPTADAAGKEPDVAKLAGKLAKQKLKWGDCPASAGVEAPTIQCATVTVPQDWHDPKNGKTWKIPISYNRLNDPKSDRFKGAIMGNPGGPGGAGLWMAEYLADGMPDLNPYYNFIGFNPRGIDASSQATCTYTVDENDPSEFREEKAIGKACANNPEVKTINTEQTTYDMDFIRHLLGLPKLNYFGYSYGTWLGSWYSKVFSSKADRIVLDSALDVTQPTYQHDKEFEPWAFKRQDDLWFEPYRKRQAAARTAGAPEVGERELPSQGASEKQQRGFLTAEQKSPSTLVRSTASAQLKDLAALTSSGVKRVPSARAAAPVTKTLTDMSYMVRCNDGQYTQGEPFWKAWIERVRKEVDPDADHTNVVGPQCLTWRTQNTMPVADSKTYPKTIVIHAELDANTVWEHGSASGFNLPNTRFIAVDNEGSHGVFPYGTEEVDRPVVNFFLDGKLPKRDVTVAQGLPRAGEDVTYEYWKPFNKKAKHYGELVTDPWQEAGTPTTVPTPVKGEEIVRKGQMDAAFRSWVSTNYGARGLAVIDRS